MLMSDFFFFLALCSGFCLGFSGAFVVHQLIVWVRNWRLARQQPSAREEATIKETAEEADDTTREDSHVSLTLLDQDLLECPICCEPLKAPIYQCKNGHVACSLCLKKLKNICPSCQFPIGHNRCRAMEKVIEAFKASCPNARYGCKEIVSYEDLSSHENHCLFAPCSCPIRDCNYTGSHKDLKNHVNVHHKERLVLFVWETRLGIELSLRGEKITILREEKDEELIVVRGLIVPHGMVVSVNCIAPASTKTGRFSCRLELKTSGNTLKQRFTVKKIQKLSEEQPEDDFVLIPSYMLRKRFKIRIRISRGDQVDSSECA